ncbi:hypothetical protein WMF39_43240 [Sorangium sp. So ce1504]|uniref:hypothetical protein n=1 Tax=Sorangium sp. So ce1504 TaxID=3133337 RepID=UPI003F5E305A
MPKENGDAQQDFFFDYRVQYRGVRGVLRGNDGEPRRGRRERRGDDQHYDVEHHDDDHWLGHELDHSRVDDGGIERFRRFGRRGGTDRVRGGVREGRGMQRSQLRIPFHQLL